MEKTDKKAGKGTAPGVLECTAIRIVSAVLFSGLFVLAENKERFTSIESLNEFGNEKFLLVFTMIYLVLSTAEYFCYRMEMRNMDALFLLISSMLYGMGIAVNTKSIYYIAAAGLLVVLVFQYVIERFKPACQEQKFSGRQLKLVLVLFTVMTFLYLGSLLVLRVYIFKPVTFDFGIFVQMFYYLKETLVPYTTCERYGLLSHFTVHFSPFFYLLLPFYVIFPSPVTLVVVQLAAVLSGVLPLYLMCRRKKASNLVTLAVCMAYLLYPSLRGGLFYDFHENKFLAPLVLWLLYFFDLEKFDRKKIIGITVFTALILAVKEDAPIYTACIGLFQAVSKKEKREKAAGIIVFAVSVIYFFVVFHFMGVYGDAGSAITSFGRYENLMVSDYDGVTGLIFNMLKDPAYVISQMLTEKKLEFLLWMFLPVLFLPLRSRNMASYILLLPLVVLNLLSNYQYQHSIYYQYTYASGTLVLYLAFLELSKKRGSDAGKTAVCMMVMSLLLSTAAISDRNVYYSDYIHYGDSIKEVRELLGKIPQEGSVSASTIYVPVLAERDEIYKYRDGDRTDYLVLELDGIAGETNQNKAEEYMQDGYHLFGKVDEKVIVLEKDK